MEFVVKIQTARKLNESSSFLTHDGDVTRSVERFCFLTSGMLYPQPLTTSSQFSAILTEILDGEHIADDNIVDDGDNIVDGGDNIVDGSDNIVDGGRQVPRLT